jgi:hypothetical protein
MSLWGLALPVCFASFVTAHLAIAAGLMQRAPRWRGWLVLLPPAAPAALYFALKERMHIRGGVWALSLLGYSLALASAYM